MSSLAGKTAVVTGSSRGVGADTAKLLAGEGANVVVNYRQKAPRANKVVKEIEETGEVPSASDLKDQLGLPPDAIIPPDILNQLGLGGLTDSLGLGGSPPSSNNSSTGASGLLDLLLGP